MLVQVLCPGCQASYKLEAALIGKQVRCKCCQQVFPVTASAAPNEEIPVVLSLDEPATPKALPRSQQDSHGDNISLQPNQLSPLRSYRQPVGTPADLKKTSAAGQKSIFVPILIGGGAAAALMVLLACAGTGLLI